MATAERNKRNEWLALMLELAELNRDAYRAFRSEVWQEIAAGHKGKSSEELASWKERAS